MSDELFLRLCRYLSVMNLARRMRNAGLMSTKEYTQIEQMTADKYRLPENSLYREIS